jgi:hypothetical protein
MSMRVLLRSGLAAGLIFPTLPAAAQDTGSGFKGFLQRTAHAITGQPTAAHSPTALPGTVSTGNAVTAGAAYRPVSPTSGGSFPDIFRTYTAAAGKFPRVALTFETFGASEACWRTKATIWTSETRHTDEIFDLCNAPLILKDDLGRTTIQADPTISLMTPMAKQTFAPGVTITPDHTIGPGVPRLPFTVNLGTGPDATLLTAQYRAIVARAMVISGYATNVHNPLMWVSGFNPNGNKDDSHAR